MILTDAHLELAIRHVAEVAPCRVTASLFRQGVSIQIGLGVAGVIHPGRRVNLILHLGEPCPVFRSVPLLLSRPGREGWDCAFFRAIPFAALGLAHEVAA